MPATQVQTGYRDAIVAATENEDSLTVDQVRFSIDLAGPIKMPTAKIPRPMPFFGGEQHLKTNGQISQPGHPLY